MIVRSAEEQGSACTLAHAHAGRGTSPDPSESPGRVATHYRHVVSTLLTVMRRHRSQSRADARMQRDLLFECPHASERRKKRVPDLMPRTSRPGFSCDQRPVVHPCSMMEKWMARQHYESASLRMRTDSTGSQRPAHRINLYRVCPLVRHILALRAGAFNGTFACYSKFHP